MFFLQVQKTSREKKDTFYQIFHKFSIRFLWIEQRIRNGEVWDLFHSLCSTLSKEIVVVSCLTQMVIMSIQVLLHRDIQKQGDKETEYTVHWV